MPPTWASIGVSSTPASTPASTNAQIDADIRAGTDAGVTGTPAFFINGRMMAGAQPFEQFKQVIEEELAPKNRKD
jgi:protein-disulfide isomerase